MKKFVIAITMLVGTVGVSFAGPNTIRFQGRLTYSDGKPIVGSNIAVRFSLYSSDSNLTSLWDGPSEQSVSANDAGLFSTDIGPIPSSIISTNDTIYLSISVRDIGGTFKTLKPRQKLASVPFAIKSEYSSYAASATYIPENSVTTLQIQDGSITSADLAVHSVGALQIQDGSIGSNQMGIDAVSSAQIKDGSIQSVDMATDAVHGNNILEGTITGNLISTGSITRINLQDGAIDSTALHVDAVDSTALKKDAVTTDKILDGAVTTKKLDSSLAAGFIPSGMIGMFASACPVGWTRFSLLDDRFPMGAVSFSPTGGGSQKITGLTTGSDGAHSHTVNPHNHGVGSLTVGANTEYETYFKSGGGAWAAGAGHSHSIGGQSSASSPGTDSQGAHTHPINSDGKWLPPYLSVVYCKKD